ncbi:hypothetical protein FG386_002735 [Cryptosporidium ryanae]|uniref:uncharacterized protein n=1 Tax=Cryptosporidium ryanae TaxID=515981 RepID=UPI00351A67B1|nr:hypothetical protein FG386_002735 [Cryptosporidium ryanae]
MKIHLTSDEINLLVYRYLMENGFSHTAFSFNSEANIPKNPFFTTQMDKVPPNALVGFLQKALLYIYLEYHTCDDTGEEIRCEEPFSIFKRHECWCRPLEQVTSSPEATVGNNTALSSNFVQGYNPSSAVNSARDLAQGERFCEDSEGKKQGTLTNNGSDRNSTSFNPGTEHRSKMDGDEELMKDEKDSNGGVSQPPSKKTKKNRGQMPIQAGGFDATILADENNISSNRNREESSFPGSSVADADNDKARVHGNVDVSSSIASRRSPQPGFQITPENEKTSMNIDGNLGLRVVESDSRNCGDHKGENGHCEDVEDGTYKQNLPHPSSTGEELARDVKMENVISQDTTENKHGANLNGVNCHDINGFNDNGTVKNEIGKNESVVERELSSITHIKLIRQERKNSGIREVQFSKGPENPNKLVITWEEGCPELWDINTGNSKKCDYTLLPVYKGGSLLAGTAVSMNENYIVIGYENGRVTLFTYSGNEIISIKGCRGDRESPIVSLKLSNNNSYLAIGDADGHVKILRINVENEHGCMNRSIKGLELHHDHDHRSAIFGLSWCFNDSYLISGCLEGEIIIYDITDNKIKSFYQEGQILSIKSNFTNEPYFTCIMDGVPYIPIFKVSKVVPSARNYDLNTSISENLKANGGEKLISLDCVSKIKLNEDHEITENSGVNYGLAPPQINFIETLNLKDKLFFIVATSYNVYLFDDSCTLVSLKRLNDSIEKNEIVSIYVDNFHKYIYVGFNDGSVNILELTSSNKLEIKSVFTSSCSFSRKIKESDQETRNYDETRFININSSKSNVGKNADRLSTSTNTIGIGTVSINSNGSLVFVGGNVPAVYIFSN